VTTARKKGHKPPCFKRFTIAKEKQFKKKGVFERFFHDEFNAIRKSSAIFRLQFVEVTNV
jgi:hypothetical protein